jgi:hypothetical protein
VNFRPKMVAAIRRGKCETRRVANDNPNSPWFRGGCPYHVPRLDIERIEKTYAICPGRGKAGVGRLRLVDEPKLQVVEDITDLGARREGFDNRDDFLAYFKKLNPKSGLDTEVWAIHFEVVSWDMERLAVTLLEAEKEP